MIVISGILFTWSLARVVCMALPRGGGVALGRNHTWMYVSKIKENGSFSPPRCIAYINMKMYWR